MKKRKMKLRFDIFDIVDIEDLNDMVDERLKKGFATDIGYKFLSISKMGKVVVEASFDVEVDDD